jgi:hypothetical protein
MGDMPDRRDINRELGEWLRDEQPASAPPRIVENVFARTTATRQVRRPLFRWRRSDGPTSRRPTVLLAIGALFVIGLIGAGTVGSPFRQSPAGPTATPTASVAAGPSGPIGPGINLVPLRTFKTCAVYPELTLVRDAAGAATSAWVTCGSNSTEVDLATGAVVDRPGLGLVAADGPEVWALKGASVVRLAGDRSVLETVPVGSPSALAVSGKTVYVLDASTGTVSAHGRDGIGWSVVPAPGGRLVGLVVVDGKPWVLLQEPGTASRLEPQTGGVQTTVAVGPNASKLYVAAGALYVASPPGTQVTRVDSTDNSKTTFSAEVPELGRLDALGGSADGLLLASTSTVERLDSLTGRRVGDVVAGRNYITAVALDGDRMFLATEDGLLIEAQAP